MIVSRLENRELLHFRQKSRAVGVCREENDSQQQRVHLLFYSREFLISALTMNIHLEQRIGHRELDQIDQN